MPFGYIPHKTLWKSAILKILGNPNMIRRVQAPVIMGMLNPQRNDLILDAGCSGRFFVYDIAKICRCIGIDWDINENLSYTMHKLSYVSYAKADVQKIPFKDKTFDTILLPSVLDAVEDDGALLKECHRVLKEKGTLVLSATIKYMAFRILIWVT